MRGNLPRLSLCAVMIIAPCLVATLPVKTVVASNPQIVTVTGNTGTFTLTFNGQTTGELAFNASAAAVQTALNALSSVNLVSGIVAVTRSGGVYTVVFGGTLAGPQPLMTAAGAGGLNVVVSPTGGNPQIVTVTGSSGTFTLTFNGQPTGALAFNASAAAVQSALTGLSTIGIAGGSVTVTLTAGVYKIRFGGTLTGPQPLLSGMGSGGAIVVVSLPSPQNRFVANGGSDANNDCSNQLNPCATIGNAVGQAGTGDTIKVAAGTYLENVVVNQNVSIEGDAKNPSTVNGNNANPVVTINDGITASLSLLTLTNGNGDDTGGGGISNSGLLTVTNTTITGNNAGGSGFGGGVSNGGVLTVANSRITSNSAGTGGGIFNSGLLTVANTTISGNPASFTSAGIGNARFASASVTGSTISGNPTGIEGAAISNGGALTITNSTISGYPANVDGDGIDNLGALTITSSTISDNRAFAVLNSPGMTMKLTNTIIADTCLNNNGTIAINDHNLIQAGNCAPMISADPKLGPLQNNGGPTLTRALLPGSPAIDAGDDAVLGSPLFLTTDQRGPGFARKAGSHVDIGAFEVQFDTCLKDNASGNILQWSSKSGTYTFTRCSDGFTLSGIGVAKSVNGIQTLTDFKADRRISAGLNTGQLTGSATIYLMAAQGVWQTIRIVGTNPAAVCKC